MMEKEQQFLRAAVRVVLHLTIEWVVLFHISRAAILGAIDAQPEVVSVMIGAPAVILIAID